jgi:Flp pilus assembly protein TadG
MSDKRRSSLFKGFACAMEGTIAVAFGLIAPMLIAGVGLAMDVSQAYLVRQRLHGAIDASALAAAATSQDDDEIEQRVRDFLIANYPPEKIGILNEDDINVTVSQSEVRVVATATFPTTFMRIMGYRTINVASAVTVAREIKGLEAVLVLDNTGSLGATNMNAVKTAARNFVTILFDRVAEADDIKIGIVPYSSSVRVGRYGLGLHADGTPGYGDPFVTLPSGITYGTSQSTTNQTTNSWYGCVVEHNDAGYVDTATHVAGSRGQLWRTGSGSGCNSAANCRGHGWAPSVTNNDPYPDDVLDEYEGPWDIYSYGRIISNNAKCTDLGSGYATSRCSSCNSSSASSSTRDRCNATYCWCGYSTPNESCPIANVLPLTSDEAALNATINTMNYEGSTYSNLGMAWGVRMLSPEAPFTEGSEWGDEEWNKAIVLMTDGEMSPSGTYSAYWASNKSTTANTVAELNERLLEVCETLKEEPYNVIIYTITFDHTTSDISDETKEIYRECASEPKEDHYFDAPSAARLVTVFERISGALANLHLRK